jgi:hypothetical protein
MREFRVDNYRVTCTDDPLGDRVWRCECPEYGRRLRKYGEGFCAHLVVVFLEILEKESDEGAPPSSPH